MIKVIIFDLDGVLVDTKMIHFDFIIKKIRLKISIDDHVKVFDGLPTNEKLKILNKKDKLPIKNFSKINKYKQKITANLLKKKIKRKTHLLEIFKYLNKNHKIAVATNAVKSTKDLLKKLRNRKVC